MLADRRLKDHLFPALRASVPVLIAAVLVTVLTDMAGVPTDHAGPFPLAMVIGAVLLGVVSGGRRWQKLPWIPWLVLLVSAVDYVLDRPSSPLFVPLVCLAIFIGWHERYQEQPLRQARADSPEPAAHA